MKNRPLHFPASSRQRLGGEAPTRHAVALGTLLAAALTLAPVTGALAQQQHSLPLVNAADRAQQGFVRIINRSDRSGTVRIVAIDDSGERFGPVTLSLGAKATAHFNSYELEEGHERKLPNGGIGSGEGDWRLELTTELDVEPLAYLRTSDGFVTSMHDIVQPEPVPASSSGGDDSIRYHVRFFNPAGNTNQVSRLRLINSSGAETVATIKGLDDAGASPPNGDITVTLPPYGAHTINSSQLEAGDDGFEGSFGNGSGKWQLFVSAAGSAHGESRPIQVVNMLFSRGTGNLTNLSTLGRGNNPYQGGDGADHLSGGGGDDVLNPGDNNSRDVVFGSAGNDRIVYTDSGPSAYQAINYSDLGARINVAINGISNSATVSKGTAGTDTIVDIANPLNAAKEPPYGGFGVGGTSFDDSFTLTLEDEQGMEVRGEAGDDRIEIRSGRVKLSYRTSTAGIDIDLAAGQANNDGFGGVDTIIGDVREVEGGSGDDTILGADDGSERLDGGPGNDTVNPRDNAGCCDRVYGSVGNDWIVYTDSTYGYQNLRYSRPETEALTALDASGVEITVDGVTNSATVDKGSAGTDTIVDVSNLLAVGALGIYGTKGDDVFDLTLDEYQSLAVTGGAGDDSFIVQGENDDPNLGTGPSSVTITYWSSPNGIDIDLEAGKARDDGFGDEDTFTFNSGEIYVHGSDFTDTIRGSNDDDNFAGRGGDDLIDGRGGLDRLDFFSTGPVNVDLRDGTATGTRDGTAFSYTISNIEHIWGSGFDDKLYGSSANETLDGFTGDDIIDGRGGDDVLVGGGGNDTFRIPLGFDFVTIRDFASGLDVIVLLGLGTVVKTEVLMHVSGGPYETTIDLGSFGGATIYMNGVDRMGFDESDFRL